MVKLLKYCLLTVFTLSVCSYNAQKINFTQEEIEFIEKSPVILLGYDPNWPPYEIYENGKYSGICNDFIQIISKRTGLKIKPEKDLTWEQSFEKLKKNEIQMVPGAGITEERLKDLIFTDNYIKLPWVVVTRKEFTKKIDTLTEFNYKNVSIPRDYLQHEILKRDFPKINLIIRNNFAECLQDVTSGVSVATVGSLGAISYFINETSSTDLTIADYTHYQDYDVAFAFPKKQIILRNIVQKGLQSISKDERNKIFSKWTEINVKKEYNYAKLWNFFIGTGIVLAIIILVFFISNKILRKEINHRKSIEKELSKTLEKINKQNDDKTILLQEIHHRVKNNLQIIISLLRLQANTHTNQEVKEALQEAIERVNSISMVHEHIYKNPNLAEIDLTAYIQNLGEELKRIFIKNKEIHINIQCNDTQLDIRPIIPLALILNELFTNSLKYAFNEQNSASIDIDLKIQDNQLIMVYKDSGKWFNNIYTRNFGTYLIEIFTDQLNGTFVRENDLETKYLFEFKDYK